MLKRLFTVLICLAVLGALSFYAAGSGWLGRHEEPGTVTRAPIPSEVVRARATERAEAARAAGKGGAKQVLFGDLHVHTTFSADAYLMSLPLLQGEGAHPPADACDFARYCSALDFWSINDHAEALTPRHWRETVASIRQCNRVAGDPEDPDVVAYLGWEWTQVGTTPEDHYGHKNVILAGLGDDEIPVRPIASGGQAARAMSGPSVSRRALFALTQRHRRYLDFARYVQERVDTPPCPAGVPVRELPADCIETAATPAQLFAKLDDWGHESIVIPHGTTWGFYTPPGSTWDKQLTAEQHDPDRQTLVEVYSGHGNSEEYRSWRAVTFDADGEPVCPEATEDYLPSCRRAGEIIRDRCRQAGESDEECERRAAEARENYLRAGIAGHLAIPGTKAEEWLDSGQCRDCFLPAFNYRPGGSAQYMTALTNFDDPSRPRRFRFGFIASSDNHTARPGTGYKERDRREMTEAVGTARAEDRRVLAPPAREPLPRSEPFDPFDTQLQGFQLPETERQASFFLTGGLVAVHADGRDRDAIWGAMRRREVYGTSGPRILLWFDLLNPAGQDEPLPMGSETELGEVPLFEVRAVGSFEQQEGCPEYAVNALSSERLHHLCRDECYNPSSQRRRIARVEIVRVRPQRSPDEPVAGLIDDPWRTIPCADDGSGCRFRFTDPEFPIRKRDVAYYVRAIEAPSAIVNGASLRCTYDDEGNCVKVDPCYGDGFRVPYEGDCLAEGEERAWSSPIYVDFAG